MAYLKLKLQHKSIFFDNYIFANIKISLFPCCKDKMNYRTELFCSRQIFENLFNIEATIHNF